MKKSEYKVYKGFILFLSGIGFVYFIKMLSKILF